MSEEEPHQFVFARPASLDPSRVVGRGQSVGTRSHRRMVVGLVIGIRQNGLRNDGIVLSMLEGGAEPRERKASKASDPDRSLPIILTMLERW
jgi:hypothetical protein